jgi:hypothetical protein
MPEAAVNEYGNFLFNEYEIRFSGNRIMTSPTFQPMPSQQCCQYEFSPLIGLPFDGSHKSGPLRFGQKICHLSPNLMPNR